MLYSAFGHLVKDTLSHSLQSFSFSHTFRQGNAITCLILSRRKSLSFLLLVWMESDSLDIATVFYADLPTA